MLMRTNCLRSSLRRSSTSTTRPPTPDAAASTAENADSNATKKGEIPPKVDYKTDYEILRKFTDVNIMKNDGRIYPFTTTLISGSEAEDFPAVHGSNMNGVDVTIPNSVNTDAKLVCFSIKEYGFQLVRSWCDPFAARYNPTTADLEAIAALGTTSTSESESEIGSETQTKAEKEKEAIHNLKVFNLEDSSADAEGSAVLPLPPPSIEIRKRVTCSEVIFVEYSFLWFARKVFADSSKPKLLVQQFPHTVLSFGPIQVKNIPQRIHSYMCTAFYVLYSISFIVQYYLILHFVVSNCIVHYHIILCSIFI